jgi:hypothetical protein
MADKNAMMTWRWPWRAGKPYGKPPPLSALPSGRRRDAGLISPSGSARANLDEGALWSIAVALTKLTAAEEARIGSLVQKAVS